MDQVKGKVAVITGAASGIGFCTALQLAQAGAKVVLADVNEGLLGEAQDKVKALGADAISVQTDVSKMEAMTNLADATYKAFGAAHIVFLNAGISPAAALLDDKTDDWRRVTDINFLGVVWGIKAFANRMIEGGEEGVILATSSGAGAEGTSYNSPAYAAVKLAVVSVMESLYGQLRDRNAKIRAGIVFPPLTQTRLAGDPAIMKGVEGYLNSKGVPSTLVQPEQVAAMVLDGIRNDRFFINANKRVSDDCYGGAIGADFFKWNEAVIKGRSEAQLADGKPDAYLW